MKIKFLGTGSAFCLNNFNSSYLITNNGKNLLFDAGTDIRFALKESRLSYKDIDSVYISHLHADHCGGIEYLAFCSFFDPNKKKINLIGDFHILMEGWEHVWSGGLNPHSGQYINEHSLSEYFTTYYLYRRYNYIKNLIWENLALTVVQTNHNIDNLKTFGLLIEDLSSHKGS
jgi:ribonuclease BN (tRNA processing enzyme)